MSKQDYLQRCKKTIIYIEKNNRKDKTHTNLKKIKEKNTPPDKSQKKIDNFYIHWQKHTPNNNPIKKN